MRPKDVMGLEYDLQWEARQRMAPLVARCKQYGFKETTESFSRCLQNEVNALAQREHEATMEFNAALQNSLIQFQRTLVPSVAPTPASRGMDCRPSLLGGGRMECTNN